MTRPCTTYGLMLFAAVIVCAGLALAGWSMLGPTSSRLRETDESLLDRLRVFAAIPPLANLVERVGGAHVQVEVLVTPGQDPHVFEISPQQVVALAKARLYFQIGMPFEQQLLERIREHRGRRIVVDTTQGIHKRSLHEECGHGHEDAAGSCAHGGEPDPHVWLSPPLLKILAANIAAALSKADPSHAADYRQNLNELNAELDRLHARIARALAPYRGQTFYVYHPAFGYFGDTYGLKQEAVETEGKSPTPRQLQALIRQARADGVRIVFLQPQFDQRSAEAVAKAIDGVVVPLDDLAPDVLRNLDDMARKIEASFQKKTSAYVPSEDRAGRCSRGGRHV